MAQGPRESEDVEPNASSSDENAQQEEDGQQQQQSTPQLQQEDQHSEEPREQSTDQDNKDQSPPEADAEHPTGMSRSDALDFDFEVKEQDRWLPIANVARIMKTALPDNAKIAKEAKECMQECVSEFISFITSEASEKCQQEKRKTVNGEDILFAMASLGFENYGEALKIYLARYRENMLARGEQQRPTTSGAGASTTGPYDSNHTGLDGTTEPGAQFGYDVTHTGGPDY